MKSNLKRAVEAASDIAGFLHNDLPEDIIGWVEAVRIIKGERFSFGQREYLKQIYRDFTATKYIVKGRQTEFTEYLVNMALYNAWRYPGTVGTYVAPRQSMVTKFSNLRVREWTLKASEKLKEIIPISNHQASQLALPNGSIIYFSSGWAGFEEVRSIPNDFLYLDEMQSMKLEEIDVAVASMDHSKYQWVYGVGTGGEYGSTWFEKWMSGRQYHWKKGAWVPQNPESDMASYWIPQHIVPWIGSRKAEDKKKTMTVRRWTTEVLGWWHRGRAKPITEAKVKKCYFLNDSLQTPDEVRPELGDIVVGIDYGGGFHTVIGFFQAVDENPLSLKLIYVERIPDKKPSAQGERLIRLLNLYAWDYGVQDSGGNMEACMMLEEAFPAKMTKNRYRQDTVNPVHWEKLSGQNLIEIDRTFAIDRVIELIDASEEHGNDTNTRFQIPAADMDAVEWIIDQLTCIEAMSVELGTGQRYVKYVKGAESDRDDFLHVADEAITALDILRKYGGDQGAAIGVGEFGK